MLSTPAPFPHVGSFALLIDMNQPAPQRAELVRIMRRDAGRQFTSPSAPERVAVAFPNRAGASGNQVVFLSELIDATPLTTAEAREHADLQRHLHGRTRLTPKLKADLQRAEALRKRAIWSTILESEFAVMRSREARDINRGRGSIGRALPREAA